MAIRPVLRPGNPPLLKTASKIDEFNTAELDNFLKDMFDTMQAEDGVGLAN